jgi:hypothetical protein
MLPSSGLKSRSACCLFLQIFFLGLFLASEDGGDTVLQCRAFSEPHGNATTKTVLVMVTAMMTSWSDRVLERLLITLASAESEIHQHVRLEDFTAVTMKNVVFWDIKSRFVPHRRHITSPLHSPAG